MMGLWSRFFGANADRKIHNPATAFETPADVVDDPQLSTSEKKEALVHRFDEIDHMSGIHFF
jgi:hypothetical protein